MFSLTKLDERAHESSTIRGRLHNWRKPGWRRVVLWALAALLGVAILFLVGMNVFLKTRLFRNLVSFDPQSLVVDYDSASSFLPGHIHGQGVSIRGKDGQVEWKLTLEEVDFTVALTDLLHRRFHATKVRGSGVVFRARQRITPDEATPGYLAALPAIDGLEAVPLKEPSPKPPPTDAEYHLWSAQLDDVVAESVHELWIDQVRYTGEARVAGGFELRPLRWVRIGPASVAVQSGEIHTAAPVVVEQMRGSIDLTVKGFDPREVHGADVLRQLTTHVLFDGVVPSLDFVDRVARADGTRLGGGEGPIHVDLALDTGKVQDGTSLELTAEHARVAKEGHAASGSAHVKAAVRGGEARVDVAIAGMAVQREDEKGALFEAKSVEAVARSRGVDVGDLMSDATYAVDVTGGVLPDLRLFDRYFAKEGSLHLEGGHGTVRGHADLGGSAGKGSAIVKLEDAALRTGSSRLRGAVTASVDMPRGSTRELDLSGSRIDLEGVTAVASGNASPWSGRVDLPSARLRIAGGPAFSANVVASCKDARPLVALVAAGTPLPEWAAGLVANDPMRATAQLHAGGARTYLRGLRAKVGAFEIGADYLREGTRERSALLVQRTPFAIGIDGRDGGSKVVLLDATGWFEKAEAELPKL